MKKLETNRENLTALGTRVKKVRKTLGISQKDFASSLDMSGSYLSEIEHGNAAPGYEFFYKVSTQYKISLDYLIHGIGNMMREETLKTQNKEKQYVSHIKSVNDLVRMMEQSSLFKNTIMGNAQKFHYENEEIIKKNIKRELEEANETE